MLRLNIQKLGAYLNDECNTTRERKSEGSIGVLNEKERLVLLETDVELELNSVEFDLKTVR